MSMSKIHTLFCLYTYVFFFSTYLICSGIAKSTPRQTPESLKCVLFFTPSPHYLFLALSSTNNCLFISVPFFIFPPPYIWFRPHILRKSLKLIPSPTNKNVNRTCTTEKQGKIPLTKECDVPH